MGRFDRENFLDVNTVNGVEELDLVSSKFDSFEIKRPTRFYKLRGDDIQRPDLLSLRLYKKQDYWWILLKVNAIDDPWNDITEGEVIIVPDISDIEEWYVSIR